MSEWVRCAGGTYVFMGHGSSLRGGRIGMVSVLTDKEPVEYKVPKLVRR